MKLNIFNNLTEQDKSNSVKELINHSSPNDDFFFLVILAVAMATFGILTSNTAVVIGSMLVAPILFPVLSLSMGVVMSDSKLVSRSVYTMVKSVVLGIITGAIITLFFGHAKLTGVDLGYFQPSIIYFAISMVAGLAASFSLVKPQLSETLPGVAISVALIPPLAAVGVGLAKFNWSIISQALMLFLVNVLGIVFASMIVFSMMNFYVKRTVARRALKAEEKELNSSKR